MPSPSSSAAVATMFQVMDIDPNSPAPPENPRLSTTSGLTATGNNINTATGGPYPPAATMLPPPPSSSSSAPPRHLTLWDLLSLGVGGTVGSGIFVLTGKIARDYAGPATVFSWILAGLAATTSALSLCELASRIPAVGSTYAYCQQCRFVDGSRHTIAIMAAACLTLEYAGSGAAVARTWGDKVVWWLANSVFGKNHADDDTIIISTNAWEAWLLPFGGWINVPALLISSAATLLLLMGVQESKRVTNFFTALKMMLVLLMIVGGFCFFVPANLLGTSLAKNGHHPPFLPYGVPGVIRGTTSAFFGYLGYDEVCVVAGEALHPTRDVPRAILATLAIVTTCYIGASLALTGMLPYTEISATAGFPAAFASVDAQVLSQISAAGELVTLPVVVLISLLAQPRLTYSMAMDGLLPHRLFARRNAHGNLIGGTLIWGCVMTITAATVPFHYLDDLISCGILVAFCLANTCLLVLRRQERRQPAKRRRPPHPQVAGLVLHESDSVDDDDDDDDDNDEVVGDRTFQYHLLAFNVLCGCTCLLLTWHSKAGSTTAASAAINNAATTSRIPSWNHLLAGVLTVATVACYARGILPQFPVQNPCPCCTTTTTVGPALAAARKKSIWSMVRRWWLSLSSQQQQSPPQEGGNCCYERVHRRDSSSNSSDEDEAGSPEPGGTAMTTVLHPPQTAEHDAGEAAYFRTPCVPLIPCLGMAINWYLIAQLEVKGLILLALYLVGTVALYRVVGGPGPTTTTRIPPPMHPLPPHHVLQHELHAPAYHPVLSQPEATNKNATTSTIVDGDTNAPYESILGGGGDDEDCQPVNPHDGSNFHHRGLARHYSLPLRGATDLDD
ncbi:hypothetical protein ACA910_015620 [Epithemia clementina (nom. ined.)]